MSNEAIQEQRREQARVAGQRQAINRKLSALQAQREALELEIEAWACLSRELEKPS